MTYGDVMGRLREIMTWLLERHRIMLRIGGGGRASRDARTTVTNKPSSGPRSSATALPCFCCLEAVRAAAPAANIEGNDRFPDPVVVLRFQLEATREATRPDASLSSYLERRPEFDLVRRWQQAARPSVEGERDPASMPWAGMCPRHTRVILKDAADLARGLVILDVRYKDVPEWRLLHQRGRLLSAATTASDHLANGTWTVGGPERLATTAGRDRRPALPGLAGVLQAQHNLAVHLTLLPAAINLRHLLVEQAELSSGAARVAHQAGSSLASLFEARAAESALDPAVVASGTHGGLSDRRVPTQVPRSGKWHGA